ncbi:MAG TPA: hypothetical protein VI256_02315 [Roseiarcus sp.]|jgi:hypothetical protein
MTIDEIVLKALESGPVTVNDIVTRFTGPVRSKLEKLRRHRAVLRDGKGGAHREFTYTLLHPNRAAEALTQKGGLSLAAKETRPSRQLVSEPVASVARQRRHSFLKRDSDHFRTRHKQKGS